MGVITPVFEKLGDTFGEEFGVGDPDDEGSGENGRRFTAATGSLPRV
jgi:hypothetical protein